MAQQNLLKLASQGRAYDASRAWSEDELKGLIALETERNVARSLAADYVRNGIATVEDYDLAVEAGFVPKSLEELRAEATLENSNRVREMLKANAEKKAKENKEVIEDKEVEEEVAPVAEAIVETPVIETAPVEETEVSEVEVSDKAKGGRNKATNAK